MKVVRVQYTVQPGYAGQNKENVAAVMRELQDFLHLFFEHPLNGDAGPFGYSLGDEVLIDLFLEQAIFQCA